MPDKEKIIEDIKELIAKYKARDINTLKDLSEANVRKDFIDPFFQILNWEVRNADEYDAESYVRGAGFADEAIKIDSKPKMFIEAKKFGGVPSRQDRSVQTTSNGHKIYADWTEEERQVLNYAGASVGVKWAILTNFEKLRLFNAKTGETVLNIEKPEEYLEKLEEILLLTNENVSNDNIDKLEERVERPDVDIHFLNLIKRWQLILATEIYDNDSSLSLEEINLFVQRILDRLVIVRYAEDNWVLDNPDQLKTIRDSALKSDYISLTDILINFFNGFDDEHNSKIFEKNENINEIIRNISDKTFNELIGELYNQSFRKFTSDILGNTYESYLSSKLCFDGGEVKLQHMNQSRKDQGIYYTPPYIVEYIVKNTLGKKLENLWEQVSELFSNKEYENAVLKFKEIYDIKVLDPSCGSGSFLIKAHDTFLKYYTKYEIEVKRAEKELKEQTANKKINSWDFVNLNRIMGEPLKNYERRILKKNLYGVDLDENAAEIASVNLMLRALKPHEKLPLILYENIKVGNSLITGVDDLEELKEHSDQIKELIGYREKIKNTLDINEKKKLEKEQEELKTKINDELNQNLFDYFNDLTDVRPFNWEIEFPEIFYDENGDLKDNNGFDVVLGNPPYYNIEKLGYNSPQMYFIKDYFSQVWMDKSDILFYFITKAIELSKRDIGFIVSNAFMFADKAQKLRNFILDEAPIFKIVNFEKYQVFKDASITTAVILLEKHEKDVVTEAINFKEANYSEEEINRTINDCSNYFSIKFKKDHVFALIDDEQIKNLYEKIDNNYLKLGDLFLVGSGMQTAANEVFSFQDYPSQFDDVFIKKRMDGEIIEKYFIDKEKAYLIYFEDIGDFKNLPNEIKDHLLSNKQILENRATVKNEGRAWWRYSRPMHKKYYDLDKIWCSYRSSENCFALDETGEYIGLTNTTVIFGNNKDLSLKYVLALLNSRLLTFRYRSIGKQTGGGVYEYFENQISKLPIPEISLEDQKPLIDLTDSIMNLNKQKHDLISSFINLVRISKQNSFFMSLKYFLDLKNAPDYKINLTKTEILINEDKLAKPRNYRVYEAGNCLYINVTYSDDSNEDVLKIDFDDSVLKEFFHIAIFIATDGVTKAYRKDKNVLSTLLSDIKIPRYKKRRTEDVENIKLLMGNLEKGYCDLIKEKYIDSSVKELSLNLINHKIKEIDNEINKMVYELYGLDIDEIRFIEGVLG